jgi:acyl dehydratase
MSDSRRHCLNRTGLQPASTARPILSVNAVDALGRAPVSERKPAKSAAPVPHLYWDDFTPGRVFEYGPRRLPRAEMVAFAAEFDPQPMHLDEEAARATMLGELCASGWYACSILMRMCFDAFLFDARSMGAPGVDEVKWLLPIYPDDEVRLRATVIGARISNSRPEMGFVRFQFELLNRLGQPAMTLTTSLMIGRRAAANAAS